MPDRKWLVGGGEMAKLIEAMDWSTTPLGPIEAWPQSLRTTVSLAQASHSPISLAWGSGHSQIYNDGYWPICGAKHPTAMGQDFRECWASAWPVIGEAYATAWAGRSAYLEKMRMFLDRYGFLEETWFTFSFSPVTDESGGVGGLFHPVTEMTSQMLSERRTKTLRDLASRAGKARTGEEALGVCAEVLGESDLDLPFVLLYLLDADAKRARLVACSGVPSGGSVSPADIDLDLSASPWPIRDVVRTGLSHDITELRALLGELAVGPYPENPDGAFALPIAQPGSERPAAVMIAGKSPRLRLDEPYRGFYDLVAAAVATALANARAYEEERRRAETLAEVDRAKTAFFSNVSHEFRTPLTLILGPIEDELAESASPLPPARHARLTTAHRNGLRLLRLVNTLLDFSRIEAGRMHATYRPTDLAVATAELASMFRSAVEKAGLALTIDCPPLPEPVWVDAEMWEKIALNLLSNALKHTFEGGITVRMAWHGDRVELSVTDTGVGIGPDDLPRVFERFHRVTGARSRSHEGTGIGLALVRELAHLHGGAVGVDSREGRGTTFVVTLPAGHAHLPPEQLAEPAAAFEMGTRAAAYVEEALHWLPGVIEPIVHPQGSLERNARGADQRPRIVLADDNADMREYVRRLLSTHYDVLALPDGAAALVAVRDAPPDLVLTDVMMPNLDGFGLLRELRADPRTRGLPVIMLSARAGEESAVEGLHAGADDYLVKPFTARELLARVRTHIQQNRARHAWARELESANKELEAFSYSVSHDLRAPLRSIDGFSQALLEDCGDAIDDVGKRHIQRVRAAAQRMGELIDDLLELSRVTRAELRMERIDLSRVVRSIGAELARRDRDRTVDLVVEDGLAAEGDARLLRIALENLLDNAWKFSSKTEAPRVEFGARAAAGGREFYVRDNGAGFDQTYVSKLFLPFQRLHSLNEFAGTGIGLATVGRIVERHGGTVRATGTLGGGATFSFTLGGKH